MTIDVNEWYDDNGKLNLTITWDENDPIESKFNTWTAQDFLTAISDACDQELSVGDPVCSNNGEGLHSSRSHQKDISGV